MYSIGEDLRFNLSYDAKVSTKIFSVDLYLKANPVRL